MPTTLNRLLTLAADTDLMKDADLTPNELLSRGLVHAKLKKVALLQIVGGDKLIIPFC
ncbi:hypothetical protein [Enterobacter hormaechei]|uniref:hypothetical protein n=1 Tax=Enterobacter hormaechei TaxID=158836 RepID=UPI000AA1514D|nr:hypothetical protein [Enterobacter hormaechei]